MPLSGACPKLAAGSDRQVWSSMQTLFSSGVGLGLLENIAISLAHAKLPFMAPFGHVT